MARKLSASSISTSTTQVTMGWLWTSPPATGPSNPSSTSQEIPSIPPSPEPPPSKPLTRDELAEKELNSILAEFTAASDNTPKKPIYKRKTHTSANNVQYTETDEPLSSQILPTTMSCRQAFDEAFYCNSFGGRFNDLYRYGTLRSCSDHWNNFWFCMKTRSYSTHEKENAVKEHYRQRESSKYSKELGKESSEDVWKSRDRKVEWGEAFNEPFPPVFEGSDDEWRARELEARKASRGEVNGTMG